MSVCQHVFLHVYVRAFASVYIYIYIYIYICIYIYIYIYMCVCVCVCVVQLSCVYSEFIYIKTQYIEYNIVTLGT